MVCPSSLRLRPASACVCLGAILALSTKVHAGGTEFPGGGTRSLGRGGAAMARADDPSVMMRNPALLADLWDDQALLGAHLLLADACFRPTGWYGFGLLSNDVADFGDGPVLVQAADGDALPDGTPLSGFAEDPLPTVCYEGPAPFLPQVALSSKLAPDLGVALGFFPPDNAGLVQWGNRDGTVDTQDGRRPNPLRFYRSHQNASFFTLMAGVGYRVSELLRFGLALQWNLAVYEVTTFTTPLAASREYHNDIRTEVFGRDLFIPGLVASVQARPLDALEVAAGFKWVDRVRNKVKLDITTGAFGTGEVFEFDDASTGQRVRVGSAIPTLTPNQRGVVDSPPLWAPQLTLALRYADRLVPRAPLPAGRRAADDTVQDSMQTERWDVELDVVYYLSSVFDEVTLTSSSAEVSLRNLNTDGSVTQIPSEVGKCVEPNAMARPGETVCPKGVRRITTPQGGKDQLTFRLGGDYNLLPGLLALRAGASYELDGQDVEYQGVLSYMLQRIGLHAGLTLRVAKRTDVSLGFAQFFQKDVRLQISDDADAAAYATKYKTPEYHFMPGAGVGADAAGTGADAGGFDGNARVELPNGDGIRKEPGPYYLNAGSFSYDLSVLSLSFAQHF